MNKKLFLILILFFTLIASMTLNGIFFFAHKNVIGNLEQIDSVITKTIYPDTIKLTNIAETYHIEKTPTRFMYFYETKYGVIQIQSFGLDAIDIDLKSIILIPEKITVTDTVKVWRLKR